MPPQHDPHLTPLASVSTVALCMIFGANAVAIKISLGGIGPLTAAGIRFALAAVMIAAWALTTGRRLWVGKGNFKPLVIICGLFIIEQSLFYLGLSRTLASRGALIVNVVPFFVLLFAHLFLPGDCINKRKFWGLVLGFVGVALVLADNGILGHGWRSGDAIVFMAAMCWAANAVYTKTVIHRFTPFQVVLFPMLCAAPLQFFAGWLWDDVAWWHIDTTIVMAVLYQSLICAAFGFVAWYNLLQRYGASRLHSFIFIMPISGVAAAGLILREPITPTIIAAVVLVALGISIVNIQKFWWPISHVTDVTLKSDTDKARGRAPHKDSEQPVVTS